jgi:outer membrane immunogenic protein
MGAEQRPTQLHLASFIKAGALLKSHTMRPYGELMHQSAGLGVSDRPVLLWSSMMRFVLILPLVAVIALPATTSATAQTMGDPAATPASDMAASPTTMGGKGFSGLYAGGSFGGAFLATRQRAITFDRDLDGTFGDTITNAAGEDAFSPGFCPGVAQSPNAGDCRFSRQGIEYYGRVGLDAQRGRFVFGIVGEFGRPELFESVSAFSITPASYTMTRDVRWNANARVRLGYTPNDTTLFYAAGGPSYARVRTRIASSNTLNSFSSNGSGNEWGYNVGGGIEQRIAGNLSIGLEYLYTDIKADRSQVRVGAGTAPATSPFLLGNPGGGDFRFSSDKMRWHSMRVTAAFRF